ncbi:MAG TPA: hypothetical protein VHP83_17915 [Aggregatilineaceae bacterium]|nr:hypothetical protein [Aggregatilineaceae bacterium]
MWWREQYINRTRTDWTRAGYRIQRGPLAADCTGHRPPYHRRVFGVIGLVDQHLVFAGQRQPRDDTHIPLEAIRRIEMQPAALLVYHAENGAWWISQFYMREAEPFAHDLRHLIDLPVHPICTYGPSRALRLVQDVYGDWHPDRADVLFLGAGALFFGWQPIMTLDQMQRVDVYPQRLRIDYTADDEFQTVGFDLAHPQRWADAISRRAEIPLHSGRKKNPR